MCTNMYKNRLQMYIYIYSLYIWYIYIYTYSYIFIYAGYTYICEHIYIYIYIMYIFANLLNAFVVHTYGTAYVPTVRYFCKSKLQTLHGCSRLLPRDVANIHYRNICNINCIYINNRWYTNERIYIYIYISMYIYTPLHLFNRQSIANMYIYIYKKYNRSVYICIYI